MKTLKRIIAVLLLFITILAVSYIVYNGEANTARKYDFGGAL